MRRTILTLLLIIAAISLSAQGVSVLKPAPGTPTRQTPKEQTISNENNPDTKKTYVHLEYADEMVYDENQRQDAQLLQGNVLFRHDEVFLWCDSAYFFEKTNSFNAYGNVRIVQGDTLFVYGDKLYYDGNTKLARLRDNVRMENREVVLTTDSLNYDRLNNVSYYFNYGQLRDSLNVLVSEFGHYYPNSKTAVFRNKVVLTNPQFVMRSDTLRYNTETKMATIMGPTHIVYNEETHIYSEYGWYHTETEQAKLLLNSYVQHATGKRLVADTIFYDKRFGKGEGFTNVEMQDTVNKISLFGNYGYYIEKSEVGLVTDSAMMMEYSGTDTLFLHADTLKTYTSYYSPALDTATNKKTLSSVPEDTLSVEAPTPNLNDSLTAPSDSLLLAKEKEIAPVDTTYKVVIGYYNVRFFQPDVQGVCDSMYYNTRDSILLLLHDPIIWSDKQQLNGDTISIYTKDGNVEKTHIIGQAFVCEQEDTIRFNQLSGREIIGYIRENELREVHINGNAQSIFFPKEEDGTLIGLNQTESSYMYVYLKEQKIERLKIYPSPIGNIYPIKDITPEQLYLRNFSWQEEKRPISMMDIFRLTKASAQSEEQASQEEQRASRRTTRKEPTSNAGKAPSSSKTTSTSANRPAGFSYPSVEDTTTETNTPESIQQGTTTTEKPMRPAVK